MSSRAHIVSVFKLDPFVTVVGVAAAAVSPTRPEGSVEQCAAMRCEQHPLCASRRINRVV